MPFMPFSILGIWLRGLLSFALIGLGIGLLREWYLDTQVPHRYVVKHENGQTEEMTRTRRGRAVGWRPAFDRETAYLAGGLASIACSLLGGPVVLLLRRRGEDEPTAVRNGEVQRLRRPDGSELQVEFYGSPDAPPIVLTHGWGANSTEWYYVKKQLSDRFRLIVWDLPGLGLSKRPDNNDYSLENLAKDLDAVVALAGPRPVVLLGHSIGGMITLTYCKLFPENLGRRIAGLVLVHTTYANPVETTSNAAFYRMLQQPVLVPLLHLMIWLWPLVWLMNWLSYLNGSAHSSTARESFAGTETRGQLDFTARFMPHGPPDVLARGMFGMLAYDATQVLPTIPVPVLIVAGDKDPSTPPEASDRMKVTIPGARLLSLSPGKHFGLMEHNARFAAAVGEFATSCSQPPSESTRPVGRD